VLVAGLDGCLYGFAGGGLPPSIKTVALLPFDNQTAEPTLTQEVQTAVREAIEEDDLMDEALVEHQAAEELISQLEQMEPGDEMYDAKFTVLGEYVSHHIAEEQKEMFPKAKKAKIDLAGLGEQMMARKQELMKDVPEMQQ